MVPLDETPNDVPKVPTSRLEDLPVPPYFTITVSWKVFAGAVLVSQGRL